MKAKDFLKDENFFELINEEFDKKIVYEDEARKTIFLVSCGSLVLNRDPTSDNLLINAKSGAGKDYIVRSVLELWNQERVICRQRISPKVLTYWHNAKFEPGWTWDGKILYLEDVENAVLNDPVFKVMSASKGGKATVVINQFASDIKINGKASILLTSASAYLEAEMLRRFPIVSLTETEEQSRLIKYKIAEGNEDYDDEVRVALSALRPVRVIVPFSQELANLFPDNIMIRTLFSRFLDYIKFSAALHQYQREIIKDKRERDSIEATLEDYEIARKCFMYTISNRELFPLTRSQREIMSFLENKIDKPHTIKEISIYVTSLSPKSLYTNLNILADSGLIEKTTKEVDIYHKDVTAFKCCTALTGGFILPSIYDEIFIIKTKLLNKK